MMSFGSAHDNSWCSYSNLSAMSCSQWLAPLWSSWKQKVKGAAVHSPVHKFEISSVLGVRCWDAGGA